MFGSLLETGLGTGLRGVGLGVAVVAVVFLILGLVALLRCRKEDIPVIVSAMASWWGRAVDHGSPVPAYEQLAGLLRERIAAGDWPSGPLPAVEQLKQEYDVERDTVLRAVAMLRAEGLVYTVPMRGLYVTRKPAP